MTTEIKTLLQNAARAAGIEVDLTEPIEASLGFGWFEWNPATNSGDSRDLQVKLKIDLCWNELEKKWNAGFFNQVEWIEFVHPDPNMAVLLDASAIGEAMKEGV